jgi:hypothetical protein
VSLQLDHVFRVVTDPEAAVRRLEAQGWSLDSGQAHDGQGTRNRRLALAGCFLEVLWITDEAEARANPLRLDRRARGEASPLGLGFRGVLHREQDRFWPYDALGIRIWIHRDNEEAPDRPLVFVLEGLRTRAGARAPTLREVRVGGSSAPSLPAYDGPPIRFQSGRPRLDLRVGESAVIRL